MADYLVTLSPNELWKTQWLILAAPNASQAEQMVWTERGYNSGEPTRVVPVTRVAPAVVKPENIRVYDATKVESARESTRYND